MYATSVHAGPLLAYTQVKCSVLFSPECFVSNDVDLNIYHFALRIHISVSVFFYTVCPGSSDPFYIVSYYIKRVTTSWTYSMPKKSWQFLWLTYYI